ncbi:alpha/beta fold hydrolase [Thalassotalea maritima]|uniref:alpha/beta fold hydrolase n=1 Tax=Thalassotalea maritima TaxID=3242416 RepID=UPI0035294214
MTQHSMLHHKVTGSGEPVVVIHGLFGSMENLNMISRPLAQQYQVISVDVRNHGKSFHHDEMTYPAMASDVIALLDHLNIESASFLGHSMGGKIAMTIALQHPQRINKLMIADIAPVTYPPHHNDIINGLQAVDLQNINGRKQADEQLSQAVGDASVRQFLLKNLAQDDNGYAWRVNLDVIQEKYSDIAAGFTDGCFTGDTLFIKGGESNYITAEHQGIIRSLFPNAKAKIIQGAGHWLHAEKPIAFNKIVSDFLQS